MRKAYCENTKCKHWKSGNNCGSTVKIGFDGKCQSFEKGIIYYFDLVWDSLKNKNYIDMVELQLNPDLRIGLYYVMDCFGLDCCEAEWGTCRMIMLKDKENGEVLNTAQIGDLYEMDMDKLKQHFDNLMNGIMPQPKENISQTSESIKEHDYGWLSPTGDFTPSPFGTHEESAQTICENQNFMDEYSVWREESEDHYLMRDFLIEAKGYALIHDPTGQNCYLVTNMKNLTKKQKEFLYGYFIDMGDRFKAEQFLEE